MCPEDPSGEAQEASPALHAKTAARQSLQARIASSVLISAGALGGVVIGGAVLSAWGMAIGLSIGSVYWWSQLLAAADDRHRSTALAPSESPTLADASTSAGAPPLD